KNNTLRYWSFDQDFRLRSFSGEQNNISDICIDPNGNLVASASMDKTVNIWNLETTELIRTIRSGHIQAIKSVDFHPYFDPPFLLTCSDDQTCLLWDVESGESIQMLPHKGPLIEGLLSVNGKDMITISEDQKVRIWSLLPSLEKMLDFVDPLEELLLDIPGEERPTFWPNEYLEKNIIDQ
ncbi:MAG: hypothetical protein AAGH79_12220, partial [Bacteroidota bacterium]